MMCILPKVLFTVTLVIVCALEYHGLSRRRNGYPLHGSRVEQLMLNTPCNCSGDSIGGVITARTRR
jgi:hypothetical protein